MSTVAPSSVYSPSLLTVYSPSLFTAVVSGACTTLPVATLGLNIGVFGSEFVSSDAVSGAGWSSAADAALGTSTASFADHVLAVVELRASKQMLRIAARWCVTVMQDVERCWITVISQCPGNSMCTNCSGLDPEAPMTERKDATGPEPAGIRRTAVHLLPESFGVVLPSGR